MKMLAATHPSTSTRSAPASRTTATVLGLLAALTGIEHGLGEITQGSESPPGVVFESWPHVSAFDPLDGEPAMSLIPNLLITGVLAVTVAVLVGVWSVRYLDRHHGGAVLVGLSVLLLLVGGGFGPPLLGTLAGLLAFRTAAGPHRQPGALTRQVARAWPWLLVVALVCFLGLVPAVPLLYAVAGVDSANLVGVLTIGAFLSTGLAMWTARAHDGGEPPRA